jgi:hypothetical protein
MRNFLEVLSFKEADQIIPLLITYLVLVLVL